MTVDIGWSNLFSFKYILHNRPFKSQEAFALFDRDRDGEINTEELGKVCSLNYYVFYKMERYVLYVIMYFIKCHILGLCWQRSLILMAKRREKANYHQLPNPLIDWPTKLIYPFWLIHQQSDLVCIGNSITRSLAD